MAVERIYKGNSIIDFPKDFVVVDIETTGFSPTNDKIIEIAAVRVRDRVITDTFTKLINPDVEISKKIQKLTGITNEMLFDSPDISSVLPEFLDFIKDDILVGHNINFDINFLYDNAQQLSLPPLSNDFIDIMRIFKKLYPELEHHRLSDLSELFEIDNINAHRALNDCETTLACYNCLLNKVNEKYSSTKSFTRLFKQPKKSTSHLVVTIPVNHNAAEFSTESKELNNIQTSISSAPCDNDDLQPAVKKSNIFLKSLKILLIILFIYMFFDIILQFGWIMGIIWFLGFRKKIKIAPKKQKALSVTICILSALSFLIMLNHMFTL